MYIADLHCDTILDIFRKNGVELGSSNSHIDCIKLKDGGYVLQNFAMFTDFGENQANFEFVNKMIDKFYEQVDKFSDYISPAFTYKDIQNNIACGKVSAVLTIEEGQVCEGNIEKLRALYDRGVRMMTFTWNYKNCLGAPNCDSNMKAIENNAEGLTEKGFEILYSMEKLGIIPDVSHLSDKGFYDVASATTKPFVASHSNSRAVCSHPRNLTDDMIKIISSKNGLIGLNYCNSFLSEKYVGGKGIDIEAFLPHINHIISVGGEDCLALGTDFDGIDNPPIQIPNASKQQELVSLLDKNGYRESTIEKICYKNIFRLYSELLK
jgi:membrane dipeptidase